MKVHEYQARQLLADAGIPVPPGEMVESVEAATAAAKKLFDGGATLAVIKGQVHAGGRGKAGFVKLVKSADEAREAAEFMFSNRMVSPQTGPEGLEVKRLLIAEGVDIAKEYYLAITVDRGRNTNTLIASAEGGVEIETVAEENPDAIKKAPLHPVRGLEPYQARALAFDLGFTGKQVGQAVKIMQGLAKLFLDTDASLAEINPLIVTPPSDGFPDGRVLAIDAKFNFDDNALFRHPNVASLFDPSEENAAELRALEHDLSYVALDGTIGCLVNGAGLAMSTMDIIKLHGGEPANFLDVGGSASEEAVREAFSIILADDAVKGVLVNIFGGIMQCDKIARAIVSAAKEVGFEVPLVVRLEGTNVADARRILEEARTEIPTMVTATDLTDAARKVCEAVAAEMLVLFDVDGTLLLSGGAGLKAMATAARALHGAHFTFDGVDFAGRLDPLIWQAAALANGVGDPAAHHDAFRSAYAEALTAHFAGGGGAAWTLPGVPELVARLGAMPGVTLGLLTGNYPETGRMKLRAAGLDPDAFPVAAWGADGPTRRDLPPVAIERWAAAHGGRAPGGEVVIIGDTPHDIDCARAHGCVAIAVATGPSYDRAALETTAPDLLLDDLSAVDAVVAWLHERRTSIANGRAT